MKIGYLHCIGGVSGDMLLGALMDSGLRAEDLNASLARLDVGRLSVSPRPGKRGGVHGTIAVVEVDDGASGVRRMEEFVAITRASDLPRSVVERACTVFERLGEAEAAAHKTSTGQIPPNPPFPKGGTERAPFPMHKGGTERATHGVDLHELGDLDTLVDVVGAVAGLEMLGIERLYCSPLPAGSGLVDTQHGILPVPSPATAALMAMAGAPVAPPPRNATDAGEMVTPTGAAIVTTLATFGQPHMNLERIGYGLGGRESPHYPNVLALWMGRETSTTYSSELALLETNIDDMSPELLAYVQERLFELGARDVWFTPIQMKKNRPATMLSVLAPADLESKVASVILAETSSLGVRVRPVGRYEAERSVVEVETSLGVVAVKVKRLDGVNVAVSPEYEPCRRLARERGIPLQNVYRIVQAEASEQLLPS